MPYTPYDYSEHSPTLGGFDRGVQNAQARSLNEAYMQEQQLAGAQAQQMMRPEALDAYRQGQIGLGQQQQAAGQLAMGTLPSQIEANNTGNEVKIGENQRKALLQGVETLLTTIGDGTDLGASMKAIDNIRDPRTKQMVGSILQAKGPQGLAQMATQLRDKLIEMDVDTAGHRQQTGLEGVKHKNALEALNIKEKGDTERANIAASATRDAANAKANAGAKGKESYNTTLMKQPPERRIGELERLLSIGVHPVTGEVLSPEEKAAYTAQYQRDIQVLKAKLSQPKPGQPNLENLGVDTMPAVDPGAPLPGAPRQGGPGLTPAERKAIIDKINAGKNS